MGETVETQPPPKLPSPLKRGLMIAGVFLLLLGTGVVLLFSNLASRMETRQDLDALLGKPPQETIPQPPFQDRGPAAIHPPAMNPDALLDQMQLELDGMSGMSVSTPEIDVRETSSAYEIRIPLPRPDDEKDVRVDVGAHHVGISGQFSMVSEDGQTTTGSASFMKTFTTPATLLPDRVTRKLADKTLVVTIPKKQGTGKQTSLPQSRGVVPPVATKALEENLPPPDTSI